MKLIIPGRLPSLNDIIDAARGNKYEAAQQKKDSTDLVMWYAIQAKLPKMNYIDLTITWYEPNKKRDKDNVEAGVKFILDGLVSAGVIVKDNWRYIGDIIHKVRLDRMKPRIEIEIAEGQIEETEG
jgi:hypothetical protein